MRPLFILLVISTIFFSCLNTYSQKIEYPKIKPSNHIDTLHGVIIADSYRNLENLEDPKVIAWFKENGKLADSIGNVIPNNDLFYKKLEELNNRTKYSLSRYRLTEDGSYFYLKSGSQENIDKLFYRSSKEGSEKLLFDPAEYKEDWRINYYKVSWDGGKVAISVAPNGQDESEVVIYDLKSNSMLKDVVKGLAPSVAGSIEWLPDNSGFIYLRFPHFRYEDPTYLSNSEAVLYGLGDVKNNDQEEVIFSKRNNSEIPFSSGDNPRISISDPKGNYITGWIGNVSQYSTTYYTAISDLKKKKLDWKLLFTKEEKIPEYYIHDDILYYRTSKSNSRFEINATPLNGLNFDNPKRVVKSFKDETIVDFRVLGSTVFFLTLKNGIEAKFYKKDLDGDIEEIPLPVPSGDTILKVKGKNLLVGTDGWTQPFAWFEYNVEKDSFENIMLVDDSIAEFENLIVEELEYASHDGVQVPLSLIYHEGMKKNARNRTLILTYGSYGVSTSPTFVSFLLVWLLKGDLIAIPHVRGGGEKGEDWRLAGYKTEKPNTWKDFIACTQFLINQGYTSEKHLAAFGNSAGGIPAGRAITDVPNLYAAAIMTAPALNMLRTEFQPNGQTNIPEFGTVKDSVEFRALLAMDSYHSLERKREYPAVMIKVGMNDGVVTPWDPAKFIARLQNMTLTTKPALLSVDFNANHSGDGTLEGAYRKYSELYAFALWQTGHPDFQLD